MRNTLLIGLAGLWAVLGLMLTPALAYTGEELAAGAKVNIDQARLIALKLVPGKISDEELETEEGGSGLRYTFNIKRGGQTYEIGIDAKTGAVLENSIEGK